MIVKYCNDGIWGFIDNVRQVAIEHIDTDTLIEEYKKVPGEAYPPELYWPDSTEPLPVGIQKSNMAFMMASKANPDLEGQSHTENLLSPELLEKGNYPAAKILLYLNEHKEYDNVILITNQQTYLLNDKGQTIERLI
jgi:hypothetical protein